MLKFVLLCLIAFVSSTIINRDVLIIGGGSSGTYTAIRLQQKGKSVAIVEKEAILGGHTNTYYDPVTGTPIDHGVVVFQNLTTVRNYFNYLQVPFYQLDSSASSGVSYVADYAANKVVLASSLPQQNLGPSFQIYLAQLAKYPWLNNGFDLPSPVPEDLLLPFGAWLAKYQIGDLAATLYLFAQGLGNLLAQPTLYMLKLMHDTTILAAIQNQFLSTVGNNNYQIYANATKILGANVYFNSTPILIVRSNAGVVATIKTPKGPIIINAKKVIISTPPKLNLLVPWLDVDVQESSLFSQFNNSAYWTTVIRNSIPDNVTLSWTSFTAPDNLPALPIPYAVNSAGVKGLHTAYFGGVGDLTNQQVKSIFLDYISKAAKAIGIPTGQPIFEDFKAHVPFTLTVSTDAIRSGFYSKLNALQGHRNTFWVGAAWQCQDSSAIWNYTDSTILPKIFSSGI